MYIRIYMYVCMYIYFLLIAPLDAPFSLAQGNGASRG